MKKIYLLALLIFPAAEIFAQSSLRQGRIIREAAQADRIIVTNDVSVEKPAAADTIYCTQTRKQRGWFEPLDTISKEQARHTRHCMFTRKNKAGNWCRLESMDGYGNYVQGNFSPYILKIGTASSDQGANSDWIEKLNTACIYECISDYSGKNIVQERAYDEDMNIVYTYSRVPISSNQFIGSYKDSYGLPAEMRNDPEYTYGTLVKITEDRHGNDSIIQFIDAKGMPKPNSDGVAMEVFVRDEYGHLLRQQSRNADGSLAIDNWGNCGIEYKWDYASHNIISATYMDDKWQPMRMPALRESGKEEVITTNYRYDRYSRPTEQYFTDAAGRPDKNALGTHRITYTHNDKGDIIKICGYDLYGNPSPVDNSGDAIEYYGFDDAGRSVSAVFLGPDGKPNANEGYLSKVIRKYDDAGNMVLEEQYSADSGEEKLTYKYERTDDCEYTLWGDGMSRIDSLDAKGRLTFSGFYDENNELYMFDGRAYGTYEYEDNGKTTVMTGYSYDESGNPVERNGISKSVWITDSLAHTEICLKYNASGLLKESYRQKFNEDFSQITAQEDANSFGLQSRSGGVSHVRHYTADILRTQQGDFVSFVGKDEFGEPDYIVSPWAIYYYQKISPKSDNRFFDEHSREITDLQSIKDSLAKVMTIEVTDSSAYALGLRDNDVIILYGDYAVNLDEPESYYKFRSNWTLRSVLDARKTRRMVVFRIEDASRDKFGLVEIKNLQGTPSELGFLPHVRYLTDKQKDRIKRSVTDNILSARPLVRTDDFNKEYDAGENYIVMAYTEMYREYRDKPYAMEITDPAILLGACIRDKNLSWDLSYGTDTEIFEKMLASRTEPVLAYPEMSFFLTKDMENISSMSLTGDAVYTNWFDGWISDEDYKVLKRMNRKARKEIKAISSAPSPYKAGNLAATWQIEVGESESGPSGRITLSKNGRSSGTVTNYGYADFAEGTAVFEVRTDYTGRWELGGNLVSFTPDSADNITLECIDLLDADEELKELALSHINGICNDDVDSYIANMTFGSSPWRNDMFIIALDRDTMTVYDGTEAGVRLTRTDSPRETDAADKETDASVRTGHETMEDMQHWIYGTWEIFSPDYPGATIRLTFNEDRSTSIVVSIPYVQEAGTAKVSGYVRLAFDCSWAISGNEISFDSQGLPEIEYTAEAEGADTDEKAYIEQVTLDYFKSQEEETLRNFTVGNLFGENFSIDKLSPTELVLSGATLKKVN